LKVPGYGLPMREEITGGAIKSNKSIFISQQLGQALSWGGGKTINIKIIKLRLNEDRWSGVGWRSRYAFYQDTDESAFLDSGGKEKYGPITEWWNWKWIISDNSFRYQRKVQTEQIKLREKYDVSGSFSGYCDIVQVIIYSYLVIRKNEVIKPAIFCRFFVFNFMKRQKPYTNRKENCKEMTVWSSKSNGRGKKMTRPTYKS